MKLRRLLGLSGGSVFLKRLGIGIRWLLASIIVMSPATVVYAEGMAIAPFRTVNQSPLVQIYGFPGDTGADIVKPGIVMSGLTQDITSNYTVSSNAREQIELDGETYRTTLYARYGLMPRWEIGIEVPYLVQGGGVFDSFIIDWHKAFGLPQGGRESAPKDRIGYRYRKDGIQKLKMEQSGSGIGDMSLTTGFGLYEYRDNVSHGSLALRAALKLPTGDSSSLRGSGGTDFLLQLYGSRTHFSEWGSLAVYGSAGGLVMSDGDVLRDQHNNLAGFGTLGLGWGPASWISFKVQLNGNTPLYRGSSLDEISGSSLMLVTGGALRLPGDYLLDIGVSEDVAVATAPDVSLHLGLSKKF